MLSELRRLPTWMRLTLLAMAAGLVLLVATHVRAEELPTPYILIFQTGEGQKGGAFPDLAICEAIRAQAVTDPSVLALSDCTPIPVKPKGETPPKTSMAPYLGGLLTFLFGPKKKPAPKVKTTLATIDGYRYRVNEQGEIAGKVAYKRYLKRLKAQALVQDSDRV